LVAAEARVRLSLTVVIWFLLALPGLEVLRLHFWTPE
jgi:hypothetical protein